MIYKFFGKKSALLSHKSVSGSGVNTHANNKNKESQRPLDLATHQLAEELRKLITKEFKKDWFILDLKIMFGEMI